MFHPKIYIYNLSLKHRYKITRNTKDKNVIFSTKYLMHKTCKISIKTKVFNMKYIEKFPWKPQTANQSMSETY